MKVGNKVLFKLIPEWRKICIKILGVHAAVTLAVNQQLAEQMYDEQ